MDVLPDARFAIPLHDAGTHCVTDPLEDPRSAPLRRSRAWTRHECTASRLRVIAGLVMLVGLMAAGCDDQPSEPTPVSVSVAGEWTGEYRITDCSSLTTDLSECQKWVTGELAPIRLVLRQNGIVVSGTADFAPVNGIAVNGVPVNGSVSESSRLQLTGSATYPPGTGGADQFDLLTWSTTVAPDGLSMTGGFSQRVAGSYIFPATRFNVQLTSALVSLAKR
jgi:hypothetical protein